MSNVRISIEHRRGCGFRKPGGIYLVSPGTGFGCGLLPIPLTICPCCGGGFRHNRGFTWINPAAIAERAGHACTRPEGCSICPLADAKVQKAGLIWIGASFYKTPAIFDAEAERLGISRRIQAVPQGFKIGESWIALAHIKGITTKCPDCTPTSCLVNVILEGKPACTTCKGVGELDKPAIFRLFKPQAIEYVVKGTETEEELARLEKRGFSLVKVKAYVQKEEEAEVAA
jgi:hypothetical protein